MGEIAPLDHVLGATVEDLASAARLVGGTAGQPRQGGVEDQAALALLPAVVLDQVVELGLQRSRVRGRRGGRGGDSRTGATGCSQAQQNRGEAQAAT